VTCGILNSSGFAIATTPPSNEEGRTTVANVGESRYRLKAALEGFWPTEFECEATESSAIQRIEMRRLGDLELEFVAANGSLAAGLSVQLFCVDVQADVNQWVLDGRVRSSGLTTDAVGRITIERLPRGAYRWTPPDSGSLVGMVEVQGGARSSHRLELP
jgi:hypothetical protein